jgi:hypothetical protein
MTLYRIIMDNWFTHQNRDTIYKAGILFEGNRHAIKRLMVILNQDS